LYERLNSTPSSGIGAVNAAASHCISSTLSQPLASQEFLRLAQHAGRNIDAVNAPGRPYRFVQIAEASAGAAADVEHSIAGSQAKTINRLPARILRQKKNPVKKRNIRREPVIPSADSITVAIDPLIYH
jgi:hypothetical protein